MSIELHCPKCRKLIRAPDSAGGRRGKCPYCRNSVYIPTPPGEGDEIGLAPIDEDEEKRAAALRREAIQYAAAIDHASSDVGVGRGRADGSTGEHPGPPTPGEAIDVEADVEAFILAMRDSKLDLADAAAARLKRAGPPARDHVRTLSESLEPPRFESVPPPVVKGFLKTLLARLD